MSDLRKSHIMFLCVNSEIAQNLLMCDFENQAYLFMGDWRKSDIMFLSVNSENTHNLSV